MKAIITVGISTSGKSTLAAEKLAEGWYEVNRDWIRFNVVKPGQDWRNYKFSSANEIQVTEIEGKMIMEAWGRGENIIISNTHLHEPTLNRTKKHLEELGYEVEVVFLEVSLEEAWKRDAYRQNGVGHSVIYSQWEKWNAITGRRTYVPDDSKPPAIIVDIDGTIAEMQDRGPFDWHLVGNDKPRDFVLDMVADHSKRGYSVLIVSGRSDECRDLTVQWLNGNLGFFGWDELHMRKAGDFRKDNAVKEEILWTQLADRYNICGVFDDRPQVLRLWYDLRIPNVICVGNPFKEF